MTRFTIERRRLPRKTRPVQDAAEPDGPRRLQLLADDVARILRDRQTFPRALWGEAIP